MANLNVSTKQFEGILPALDPRQPGKPFIIDGENYVVDIEGPNSAFGALLLDPTWVPDEPENVRTFRIGDDTLVYCSADEIKKYVTATRLFGDAYDYSMEEIWTGNDWAPWSHAFVGDVDYFYHPNLMQNIITRSAAGTWGHFTDGTYFPASMVGIGDCRGHLVIVGEDKYVWSELDDGTALDDTALAGAGFQGLSIVGGTGLGVENQGDSFLVYTTRGVIRASYTGSTAPVFRHVISSRAVRAINTFSIVNFDDETHVILAQDGLWSNDGGKWAPFSPLFSEYLVRNFLRNSGLVSHMYFSQSELRLYVSFRASSSSFLSTRSFVLDIVTNKWGQFNRSHYAFLEVDYPYDAPEDIVTGHIDENGMLAYFRDVPYYQTYSAGAYTNNALASWVDIGMFRYEKHEYPDELGLVTDLTIGYSNGAAANAASEDWSSDGGSADWSSDGPPAEDWGSDEVEKNEFDVTLIGMLDGQTVYQSQAPNLVTEDEFQNYYTSFVEGIYFKLKIEAMDAGQSFHLTLVELSGSVAGRLN